MVRAGFSLWSLLHSRTIFLLDSVNSFFAPIWYSVVLDKDTKKKGAIRNGKKIG